MISQTSFECDPTPAEQPLVCGYVITYGVKRFLDQCLRSLQQLTDYENHRVIVVDNGSSDGAGDYVRTNFPELEILRVFPNVGFARGINEAIQDARRRRAKHIVIMHDDIAILHSQWLREAVAHAERDPSIGIISFVESTIADGPHPAPQSQLTAFEYLGGSAVFMVPVGLFDRIGMIDEVYYLAGEDDDLGARAQAAGYRTVKLGIPVYHLGGGTAQTYSLSSAYLHMRNGIRFCIKNRSAMHALMRAGRFLDVACNPWPVTFDNQNGAHLRMRNSANLVTNLLMWVRAVSWNLVRLPQTYRIRAAERRLIRTARPGPDPAAQARTFPEPLLALRARHQVISSGVNPQSVAKPVPANVDIGD